MAVTPGMAQLSEQLHTNQTLRAQYQANPAQAVAPFDLTSHERDAVVTKDCDDLVAIGLAANQSQLPTVLGCGGAAGIPPDLLKQIIDALKGLLTPIREVPKRLPDRPDLPFPGFRRRPPRPDPRPGPRPPGPTPGPDPPKPDRPGREG